MSSAPCPRCNPANKDPAINRLQWAVDEVEKALAGYDHNAEAIYAKLLPLFPDATSYSSLGLSHLAHDEIVRLRNLTAAEMREADQRTIARLEGANAELSQRLDALRKLLGDGA